ncbi:MAG: M81 family metallopeptidase [Thermomicrobiales bacterium]|nr:M81 family metallopeptidase [Thermomicrobiales bacterium]MCO5220185.1 M81 family metallopeptidase [Thermomicrobiales bacterium]
MRLLLAGISHESNTFAETPTDLDEFIANGFFRGAELLDLAGTNTVIGGAVGAARELGVELMPVVATSAIPGGVVADRVFESVVGAIETALAAERPDAIVLDLHGAMVTESHDDGDGALLERVRAAAGPEMPIVATLDLHANVGPQMLDNASVLIPFDTYPHVDNAERGDEAVRLAVRMASGAVTPVMTSRKLPILPDGPRQFSGVEPTNSIMGLVHEIETRPGVLTAGVCFAFPWADCPFAGMTVTVVTDNDPVLAEILVDEIATFIWARRAEFKTTLWTVEEAIHAAMQAPAGPVVLADLGDNPGGGTAADGTSILWGLIDLGAEGAVVSTIRDPEVVALAFEAGEGAEIETMLGAKTDERHGYPIPIKAVVKRLSNGDFVYEGPMERGVRDTLGRTAVLGIHGRYGADVEVIVCERRVQSLDTAILRSQGIEPTERKIIALKSAVHFRGAFMPIAAQILEVDTPGLTSLDYSRFPYQQLPRPIWPMDDM